MGQAHYFHDSHFKLRTATIALGFIGATSIGLACAGVGPPRAPVIFGDQTNIIVWDEANGVEHFIRNASFRAGATDFGFIAPTPTKPELSEASTQAFETLGRLQPGGGFGGIGGGMGGMGGGGRSRADEVKVIQEADVSGYRATTLFARNGEAINDWMKENGYVSSPAIEQWADRYAKRGWYLTAFKIIDRRKGAASTGTIRMSFKTNAPYNPFYVPHPNIPERRGTLRVYFVSVGDYESSIGYQKPWQTPRWTAAVPKASADRLAEQLKLVKEAIPEKSQVAVFVDNDFPRPVAEDIYFAKKKPPVKEPEPPAKTIPPLAMATLLAGTAIFVTQRRRR